MDTAFFLATCGCGDASKVIHLEFLRRTPAMSTRRRYRKKAYHPVVAVRLDLDTEGFSFRKWGAVQHCKRGDWIVSNDGDTYTVDGEVFARTYR